MGEYSSNSNTTRGIPDKKEKQSAVSVVQKPAEQRDPGVLAKLLSTFIHEDIRSVRTYLWKDILSPALKRSAVEAVKMFLHVESPSGGSNNNPGKTSYYNYYDRRGAVTEHPREERRIVHDYLSTRFYSRSDAEAVRIELESIIEANGYTTINDFYIAASMEPRDYTYDNWGWGDLRGAIIKSEYSYKDNCTYYCLKMPHAHPVGTD